MSKVTLLFDRNVSRNTPELLERGQRGHESLSAIFKKQKPARIHSRRKCCRNCSYWNAGWIEPKIANASNAGKLQWSVSLAIELLKGKVTHFDKRLAFLLLVLSKGSSSVTQCKAKKKKKVDKSIKNSLSKNIKKRAIWLDPNKQLLWWERHAQPHVSLTAVHLP